LFANQDEKIIGAGTFTFIRYLMPCCDVFIKHSGPFQIAFYELEVKYLDALDSIGFINFYLPGKTPDAEPELWGYQNATMGRNYTNKPVSGGLGGVL